MNRVIIPHQNVVFPGECACCLSPSHGVSIDILYLGPFKLSYDKRSDTAELRLPLCLDCREHVLEHERRRLPWMIHRLINRIFYAPFIGFLLGSLIATPFDLSLNAWLVLCGVLTLSGFIAVPIFRVVDYRRNRHKYDPGPGCVSARSPVLVKRHRENLTILMVQHEKFTQALLRLNPGARLEADEPTR